MHAEAMGWLLDCAVTLDPQHVVEIGAKNINGSARYAFLRTKRWWGCDVVPGPDVDAVVSGALMDPPFSPDLVVCCEVFEHTEDAPEIVKRAFEVLQPGGVFLATMASVGRHPHSAVDGAALRDGEYYRNVSPEAMIAWLTETGFSKILVWFNEDRGDLYVQATKADE